MPSGANAQHLKGKVEALQLNTEGLFKLLGSNDPDKRLRFYEILKGITTPAEFRLVDQELTMMNALVTQCETSVKSLVETANEIGGATKAASH